MASESLFDRHLVMLVTGIPGSGKSTIAELLAQRLPRGVHVRGDVFRRMIRSGREEITAEPSLESRRQLQLRYRLGAATTDAFFEAGFSVIVQDVVLGAPLSDYVALLKSRPLIVVVLSPRADVVDHRDATRPKTAYWQGAASVQQLDGALRDETPRVGLWLDTSERTPVETVDEISRRAWAEGRVE